MRGARLALGVLVCSLPLGAALGVLWHWWWSPPLGIVVQGQWVLQPAGPDLAFDGTALFVLIGVVVGLVAGVAVGYLVRDAEFLVLGSVLLGEIGGPGAVTAFWRSMGDRTSRLDYVEPKLNVPDGERNTTTPAAMMADMKVMLLGEALAAASRSWPVGRKRVSRRDSLEVRLSISGSG